MRHLLTKFWGNSLPEHWIEKELGMHKQLEDYLAQVAEQISSIPKPRRDALPSRKRGRCQPGTGGGCGSGKRERPYCLTKFRAEEQPKDLLDNAGKEWLPDRA